MKTLLFFILGTLLSFGQSKPVLRHYIADDPYEAKYRMVLKDSLPEFYNVCEGCKVISLQKMPYNPDLGGTPVRFLVTMPRDIVIIIQLTLKEND